MNAFTSWQLGEAPAGPPCPKMQMGSPSHRWVMVVEYFVIYKYFVLLLAKLLISLLMYSPKRYYFTVDSLRKHGLCIAKYQLILKCVFWTSCGIKQSDMWLMHSSADVYFLLNRNNINPEPFLFPFSFTRATLFWLVWLARFPKGFPSLFPCIFTSQLYGRVGV